MKMSSQLYNATATAIGALLESDPGAAARYSAGEFPRSDRCKDLNMRFRWDVFHHVSRTLREVPAYAEELRDLDDAHIDTALRRIVPAIERQF